MGKREDCKNGENAGIKVAVVGTGISGLSSAWALAREGFDVTLFGEEERLGGHSLTFPGEGNRPPVDLGFQVFNLTTYPYLTQFFEELGVDHEPSDMSFSFSADGGSSEWASHNLDTIFAQKKHLMSPSFLRMMYEVVRFGKEAPLVLQNREKFESVTLGEYLDANKYSERFRKEYLLPTTAAVWSVPNKQMEDFPVLPLIAFLANHHLLNPLGDRPRWRVVKGRSEMYVKAVEKSLQELGAVFRLGSPVVKVERETTSAEAVQVTTENGHLESFDHVILSCHSDTCSSVLFGEGAKDDKALVKDIRYQPNDIYLHSDANQMPRCEKAWASWNVLDKQENDGTVSVCVTYWLNHLQNLPDSAPLLLCTLNPLEEIDSSKVVFKTVLHHPVFDTAAMQAQRRINEMQADPNALKSGRRIWFSGAWLGSGFHEDGIRSAVAVATAFSADGKTPPAWARQVGAPEKPALQLIRGPSPEKSWGVALGMRVFEVLATRGIKKGYFRMVLPDGNEFRFGRDDPAEATAMKEPCVTMRVYDLNLLWMCVADSDIGLGRAYRSKMFDVDNLVGLFDLLIENNQSLRDALNPLGISSSSPFYSLIAAVAYAGGNLVEHLRHLNRDNTVAGSRKNIEEHYDLGNDMYKLFLDDSMTYSCGIHRKEFGADVDSNNVELDLYDAQMAKLDWVIKRAELTSTDHVLEIGCGWGSFAIRAASTIGCRVTGITISTEQLNEARARVKEAGLEDKVNLIICDYRKMGIKQFNQTKGEFEFEHGLTPGYFDKIVSIEMLEAVGHNHLPEYFETVERMLKRGGKAVVQVISMDDARYEEYCSTSDFIRECIFPGGHLPSLGAVKWATKDTTLDLTEVFDIGPDYAITLRMWRERFLENKDKILALGYPESWFRIFEMYFAYCEAGFRQKYIFNYHLTFTNSGKTIGSNEGTSVSNASEASILDSFDAVILPAIIAFMSWVSMLSLTLNPLVRNFATILCASVVFASLVSTYLLRLEISKEATSRRFRRRSQLVFIQLCVSVFVCLVVVGLIAFHDVLYTTRVANVIPWPNASAAVLSGRNNVSLQEINSDLHFCHWGSEIGECTGETSTTPLLEENADAQSTLNGKYYIKSPMHFVVCVLAWASVSRFLIRKSFMRGIHALALLALTFHSYSEDKKYATTALGLAIIHGVSELHACFRYARTLLYFRGYNLSNQLYYMLWCTDFITLIGIRWVPVPILLYPVILKSPWAVLLPICAIATRETMILVHTLSQWREERENLLNTDKLLSQARSREELIKTMSRSNDANQVRYKSSLYSGTVHHRRNKVDGVTPSSHQFNYNVWMALIDLEEVKNGVAFQDSWLLSVNEGNIFSWHRKDHFGPGSEPLDETVRQLVFKEVGKAPVGPIILLTNIRCFGFVFNPVSIYYCLTPDRKHLEAVVLEVSNTPWLERRLYVLPFFDHPNDQGLDDRIWYSSKWKKDFHVSPFFDVFFNYEWKLTVPGKELFVKASSTRRPKEAAEKESRLEWIHETGDSPTQRDIDDEGAPTFFAGLHLRRSDSAVRHLLFQPFMTFSVVLYIHVHAAILMIKKGAEYKLKPSNSPYVGFRSLLHTLAIFSVGLLWDAFSFPFHFISRRAFSPQHHQVQPPSLNH